MPLRRRVAAWLEEGSLPSALSFVPSFAYERLAVRRLARPLIIPPHVRVIGVGSAVIGGAGKTPVAAAWAKALADRNQRVAVVAHGYHARVPAVRRVAASDSVQDVGDDALVVARALRDADVPVWVGPHRQDAVFAAAEHADTIVIDGMLQAQPVRVAQSLLVLDASHPWGAGRCLPAGDLRAPRRSLLEASDQVVLVVDGARDQVHELRASWPGAQLAHLDYLGFSTESGMISLAEAAHARLGVLLLIGRPRRVLDSLHARGVRWACSWLGADHDPPGPLDRRIIRRMAGQYGLDGWLVTPKCRAHLSVPLGAPLWTIETSVRLDPLP